MKHQDMIAGTVTHEQYYSSVAKSAKIDFEYSAWLPEIKQALDAGDTNLNTVGLHMWDDYALMCTSALKAAFKKHGDVYTLSGAVCALKQAAVEAAIAAQLSKINLA